MPMTDDRFQTITFMVFWGGVIIVGAIVLVILAVTGHLPDH